MRKGAVAVLAMLGLAASSAPTLADCASQCAYAYGGYGSYNYTTCYHLQCEGSRTPMNYGAIAFGARTASWGISYGKPNSYAAGQSALQACQQHGNDCALVSRYLNRCSALATVRAKAKFATAQAGNLADAKAGAMKACQAQLGSGCQLWVFTCAWDTK